MNYLIVTILLLLALIIYFKIAVRFNIVDVPNHRSSHSEVTIRGAGIILPLSVILCGVIFQNIDVLLLAALLLISAVSFVDDITPLSASVRLIIHAVAVTMAFYALGVFLIWPVWMIALTYIFMITGINAYNFMDGINGITGVYSLVTLLTFFYLDNNVVRFADDALLLCPAIGCIIFLYFNFRKRARCFAGDVGSIGMAFWLVVVLIMLVQRSGNYKYLFVFSVYGFDVFFTIIKRIKLGQNLTQPHRLHLYQLLVNHGGFAHRRVGIWYALAQISINICLLVTQWPPLIYLLLISVSLGFVYVYFEQRYRLKLSV